MHPARKRRLILITILMMTTSITVLLVLFALRRNIDLYFTPSQLSRMASLPGGQVRIGGLIKNKSLHHGQGLAVGFSLTDDSGHMIKVDYHGVLPGLFAEGKGAVISGRFDDYGRFKASRVLAKHDEYYRPPGIKSIE